MKRAKEHKTLDEKLDRALTLLTQLVAIELANGGVPQAQIGKLLGISTGSTNALMKGYKPPEKRG